jgi:hypothetical protein
MPKTDLSESTESILLKAANSMSTKFNTKAEALVFFTRELEKLAESNRTSVNLLVEQAHANPLNDDLTVSALALQRKIAFLKGA